MEYLIFLLPLTPFALAKSIWSSIPAVSSNVIQSAYPVGNGLLGLLSYGDAGREILNINRDSLWTGGPFENSSYVGGNTAQRYQYLPSIRETIWEKANGSAGHLKSDYDNYGSYTVLGFLAVRINDVSGVTNYRRSLDLETGIHTTSYSTDTANYTIDTYCSYPAEVCVYDITSTSLLPEITISVTNKYGNASLITSSCSGNDTQLRGITQEDIGMNYQSNARFIGESVSVECTNGTVVAAKGLSYRSTIILSAGTDFDQSKGNAASNYTFRGEDPASYVQGVLDSAASQTADELSEAHIADYSSLADAFQLDLPDTQGSAELETSDLIASYNENSTTGDPYLESVSFDFARHLFISSSRDGSLPPNLQGRWADKASNAWGADYHANINLQMNHWHVDQTGLGGLQTPLWDYMAQNWAPRGAETAQLVYNASGWVTHDEMNIFGYTAMKNGDDKWANYPISAAWMMLHVWDYFDYSQDVAWLEETGYPMLKAISSFWLSQLQEDQYYNDGTLVVNPCSSPEHSPTTFGCTHWQQLLHQLFETTLQSASAVDESDSDFISDVQASLLQLDKGLYIGSWGQIQEWKQDIDTKNDTHRHLSHLVGWYPSFSLSSYLGGYQIETIQNAVATSLYSRGPGIEDDNAGWEKVWRSACWARLNNTDEAYSELRLTIGENWAPNMLSMYSGHSTPFQIDANFGFAGAVLSMLVVDLPQLQGDESVRTVVLGPAIPAAWANGSVKGLRLRGGGSVDFAWDEEGLVTSANITEGVAEVKVVNKEGMALN